MALSLGASRRSITSSLAQDRVPLASGILALNSSWHCRNVP